MAYAVLVLLIGAVPALFNREPTVAEGLLLMASPLFVIWIPIVCIVIYARKLPQ